MTILRKILMIALCGSFLLSLSVSYGFEAEHKFTIIYTGKVHGQLTPCG
ncbi:hypothetical protein ACFL6S_29910 [Candidatus Poribacteria bacterium]